MGFAHNAIMMILFEDEAEKEKLTSYKTHFLAGYMSKLCFIAYLLIFLSCTKLEKLRKLQGEDYVKNYDDY